MTKSKNGIIDAMRRFFLETDEDDVDTPENETKEVKAEVKPEVKPVAKQPTVAEPVKKEPVKVEKPATNEPLNEEKPVVSKPVSEEKKVEKVAEVKKEDSNFINIDAKIEEDRKEQIKKAREAYRPQNVISPIFGSKNNDYSLGNNQLEIDTETVSESVIGTVFSPINGRGIVRKETVKDVVDEKVANMTTSDFIIRNDETTETTTSTVKHIAAPKLNKTVKSEESKAEDKSEKFENLSLFD